ncbi:hypothetical protein SLA2020_240520 [Shorea laevis]
MEGCWFDEPEHPSGFIGARRSADAATIHSLVGDALSEMVSKTASIVVALVFSFLVSWQLALILLALAPLLGINANVQVKFTKGFSADAKLTYEEASQVANDATGSIRTIASFCAEEKVMNLYKMKCEGPLKTEIWQGLISGIGFGLSLFLLSSVFAINFYAGAKLVEHHHATFLDFFKLVFFPLAVASIGVSQSNDLGSDSTKARRRNRVSACQLKYPLRPDIQISQDLSLAIHAGKTVASVGESGSRKSTLYLIIAEIL